jgi:ribosomal protein L16 Arg81 hydroxylase
LPTVQVVLEAGDVLYIPSYWFHYIISTGITAQCNTRSGNAVRGRDTLTQCGFY